MFFPFRYREYLSVGDVCGYFSITITKTLVVVEKHVSSIMLTYQTRHKFFVAKFFVGEQKKKTRNEVERKDSYAFLYFMKV